MWPFPNQHILLLILHCGQTRCQFSDFSFDWSNHVWKTRMFRTRSYTTMGLHTVTGNIDDAMHVETTGNHEWNSRAMTSWMRSYLTTLSEIALIWFEKQYSCRPSFSAVIETWPVDSLICFPSTTPVGSCNYEAAPESQTSLVFDRLTQKSISKWPPSPTWYVTVIYTRVQCQLPSHVHRM